MLAVVQVPEWALDAAWAADAVKVDKAADVVAVKVAVAEAEVVSSDYCSG